MSPAVAELWALSPGGWVGSTYTTGAQESSQALPLPLPFPLPFPLPQPTRSQILVKLISRHISLGLQIFQHHTQHLACPKVGSQVSGLIFEASGSSYFDSPSQFQESNQGISCSNPPNSREVSDSSLIPGNSPDEKSSCFMGESYRPSIAYPCLPSGNDCHSSRK